MFLESANEITRWLCPNNKNVPVSFKQYIRYISFSSRRPLIGSSIPVQKRRGNESGVCCTQTTNRTSQIVTHTKIKLLQLNQAADWVERAYRKRRANENRRGLCPNIKTVPVSSRQNRRFSDFNSTKPLIGWRVPIGNGERMKIAVGCLRTNFGN